MAIVIQKGIELSNPPLKILQILRSPIGGLFRHVVDLSTELIARGHEVGIVLDGKYNNAQSDGLMAGIKPSLKLGVHILPMSRVLDFSDITTPLKIRNLAKSLNIDVLHGHGAKGGVNARFARHKNSVAIYTPHGGVLHFSQASISGKIFRLAEKILLTRTDAIIFESEHAQREFHSRIIVPNCKGPVIHNGLKDEEFNPIKITANAKDFAFMGELRQLKGINYLLDALVDVRAPDGRPATLALAGSGKLIDEIKARIKLPDLNGRVEMIGVRPAREILSMSRCLIVPSLKESLPYVVLEASAASHPIIATRVGGINEIFGPTASHLIEAANSDDLRKAMQDFLDNQASAIAEAKIRFEHVKKTFSIHKMVDEIETIYKSTILER